MSVEELKAAFALLADPVVPDPDPYGRLLERARRSRWHRWSGWGSALAAAIVAALLGSLVLQGSGAPHPPPSDNSNQGNVRAITPWVRRLLESPPRGRLANDPPFVAVLTAHLHPSDLGLPADLDQRSVLFADNVAGHRAVLVAFHSKTRQSAVWLIGGADTDPAMLAKAADPRAQGTGRIVVMPGPLLPYASAAVTYPDGHLAVGLVPAGCRIASWDIDHPNWRDSATGDYIVRTGAQTVDYSTYVRVACAGTVYFQAPLPSGGGSYGMDDRRPSEADVDAALVGVRGTVPDRNQVRDALRGLTTGVPHPAHDCKVLFFGRVPGTVESSPAPGGTVEVPPLMVIACITVNGNTRIEANGISADGPPGHLSAGGGVSRVPYTDPHAIIAVRALVVLQSGPGSWDGLDSDRVLVLAPRNATRLQILDAGRVTGSVPLTKGIGAIRVAAGHAAQVRALDRSGAVVGSGTAPTAENIPEETPPKPPPLIESGDWLEY